MFKRKVYSIRKDKLIKQNTFNKNIYCQQLETKTFIFFKLLVDTVEKIRQVREKYFTKCFKQKRLPEIKINN